MAEVNARETQLHAFSLQVHIHRIVKFDEPFSVLGCRLWNRLPEDMVKSEPGVFFKGKIFLLLLNRFKFNVFYLLSILQCFFSF